mgnify:CR=1 FL=1
MTTTTFPNFFAGLSSVEEIKKAYRKLAFQHHPDMGGDLATMQEINRQYEIALRGCDGQTSYSYNGKGEQQTHTYTYSHAREKEIQTALDELIKSLGKEIAEGKITADLIGIYIWIGNTTREMKDVQAKLRELNFSWHSKRQLWYWHPSDYSARRYAGGSLEDLANKYGATNLSGRAKQAAYAPTR